VLCRVKAYEIQCGSLLALGYLIGCHLAGQAGSGSGEMNTVVDHNTALMLTDAVNTIGIYVRMCRGVFGIVC
jgi:hypothetical protein